GVSTDFKNSTASLYRPAANCWHAWPMAASRAAASWRESDVACTGRARATMTATDIPKAERTPRSRRPYLFIGSPAEREDASHREARHRRAAPRRHRQQGLARRRSLARLPPPRRSRAARRSRLSRGRHIGFLDRCGPLDEERATPGFASAIGCEHQ